MPNLQMVEQNYRHYALYEKGHQPSTVTQTVNIVRRLCEHACSDDFEQFNTPLIRAFLYQNRKEKEWSAKTFRIYRQYLKTFFQWACKEGMCKVNPIDSIDLPTLPQNLPRCLTKNEALQFLSHARSYPWFYELEQSRNVAIVATFLYTGIRLSELLNLREDEVWLSQDELRVTQGKNRKDRMIAIHPHLKPCLMDYLHHKKRLDHPSVWFFPSVKSNKRLSPKNVQTVCRRVSKASGIKATPHMLRHTCGRLYVEDNVNLRIIQTLFGHSRIETTERYTYVSIEAMKESLARSKPL